MVKLELDIPEKFYDDEYLSDFQVTSRMKKVWAVELDLLNKLLKVCDKYKIKFYMDGGSLLGTIRHGGFIPWDDDIDVVMLRPEYEKLCSVANKEFSYPYFFQNYFTEKEYTRGHAQLRNSETTAILNNEKSMNLKTNQGIFIDIFVLDGVNENSSKMKKQESKINFIKKLMYIKVLQTSRFKLVNKLSSFIPWKMLALFYDRALKMSKVENSSKIANLGLGFDFGKSVTIRDKTFYDECIFMPFEMLNVPVPKRSDEWLTLRYGNYMKPSKAGAIHSGIFFDTEKSYKEYTE